jgi:hypothetical protein
VTEEAEMNEPAAPEHEPPHAQAWLALACPLLAWISQAYVALFVRGAAAEVYLLAMIVQGLLLAGGFSLGIAALARRGRGGASVVVPATIGLLISTGTLLLIGGLVIMNALR